MMKSENLHFFFHNMNTSAILYLISLVYFYFSFYVLFTQVTYRRVEYILPVDFLTWSIKDPEVKAKITNLTPFSENHKHDIDHVDASAPIPEKEVLTYMLEMKNIMKLLRSTVVSLDTNDKGSVLEKQFNMRKRKQHKSQNNKKKKPTTTSKDTNDNDHEQSDDLQTSKAIREDSSSADANLTNNSQTILQKIQQIPLRRIAVIKMYSKENDFIIFQKE